MNFNKMYQNMIALILLCLFFHDRRFLDRSRVRNEITVTGLLFIKQRNLNYSKNSN